MIDLSATPMMACGHAANAESEGAPCCVICVPDPDAYRVVAAPPLAERTARCPSCGVVVPSHTGLAFFSYRAGHEHDSFYCGCGGWD